MEKMKANSDGEEYVVQSCERVMDADVTIIVSGKYEGVNLVLHEMCRSAIRRALGSPQEPVVSLGETQGKGCS